MSVDPVAFLERAVPVDSTEDLTEMRELLVETLEAAGAAPRVDAAGNVRATRGSGAPHLLFNTHVDTVPPHLPAEVAGERIRGRGACDAKGPLAAMVAAFLDADVGSGTLTLAVTPDEETLSTGAHALVAGEVASGGPGQAGASVEPLDAMTPPPSMVVVGEPTELDVCTAARGRFEGTLSLSGTAAHAADPDSGANAVAAAGAALRSLESYAGVDPHPTLGAPTLVPTGIEGGVATNQVPASCEVTFDRRSVPPETAEGFRAGLASHLRESLAERFPDVGVEVTLAPRETPFLEAFSTPTDAVLVGALSEATVSAAADAGPDDRGEVRPFGAATEASYFASAPTVVFGPGALADEAGAVAHAEREYVDRAAVRAAATALRRVVERLLEP